jgi:tetratricopeptide (TPR) repeat protein
VNYWLGQRALSQLRPDEAEKLFVQAYTWRARWPAVTGALANLYLAFEEPARSLDFYDQTLALVPGYPDAMLGRVKALSVLGRHDEAFDAIQLMIGGAVRILPGEAYYWRAWNDLQVGHLEEAWTDIEEANRLWTNSEVSKLGGIVAYGRRDLETAQRRFEVTRKLNPGDCETTYYLGVVQADQREWMSSVDVFTAAATCFERAQQTLQAEIDAIRRSSTTDERKTRQIMKREQQMSTAGRMLATSFFNTAVACFNLSRFDEARLFAGKVADDEQFAGRVQELLRRMSPQ